MRKAVIFDMDGTLADVRGIRHHVVGRRRRDFDAFHADSVNVPPTPHVANAAVMADMLGAAGRVEAIEPNVDVVVVTARKVRWARHTAMWLAMNRIPSAAMFMRADKDSRPDGEVKRDILRSIRRTWDVIAAWDDNPKIVALWESEGITTHRVDGWVE